MAHVDDRVGDYCGTKDKDLVREDDGLRDSGMDSLFSKGQSKRIWGELYKVIDSSDVVIQARHFSQSLIRHSVRDVTGLGFERSRGNAIVSPGNASQKELSLQTPHSIAE